MEEEFLPARPRYLTIPSKFNLLKGAQQFLLRERERQRSSVPASIFLAAAAGVENQRQEHLRSAFVTAPSTTSAPPSVSSNLLAAAERKLRETALRGLLSFALVGRSLPSPPRSAACRPVEAPLAPPQSLRSSRQLPSICSLIGRLNKSSDVVHSAPSFSCLSSSPSRPLFPLGTPHT